MCCLTWWFEPQTRHRSAARNAMVGVVALWYLPPFLQAWHDDMLIHSWCSCVHVGAELRRLQHSQNNFSLLTRRWCTQTICGMRGSKTSAASWSDNLYFNHFSWAKTNNWGWWQIWVRDTKPRPCTVWDINKLDAIVSNHPQFRSWYVSGTDEASSILVHTGWAMDNPLS